MTALGKFIAEQIKEQGISAKEMAGRMKINPTFLSKILNGKISSITLVTFCQIISGIGKSARVRHGLVDAAVQDFDSGVMKTREK